MSFKNNLKTLRLQHNLTQEELAECLYISNTNISKYESGALEPSISTLATISDLFNVSVDCLLGLSNIPEIIYPSDLNEEELKKVKEYIDFLKTTRK